MKKVFFLVAFLAMGTLAFSQAKVGIRAGFSTTDVDAGQLLITDSESLQEFSLAVSDAKYGLHAGLFFKFPIGDNFFIQPEVVFNSNKVDYSRENLGAELREVFSEAYQHLDIPLIAGFQFGPLKPQLGLVGHVFLNSSSDFDLESYKQDFQDFTLGWQGGLGLEFGSVLIDFKYEGNFTKFGSHFNVGGQSYQFDDSPSRLIVSLGYAF